MSDLPGGASIPVQFHPGQPLTASDLNEIQRALMRLLLTHTHTGNDQANPQGALIGPDAIAPNAVKGPHIGPNAVTKGDIHNGAVGASEIQEKCIGSNHMVDGAVSTRQIADEAVTMAKLADEVVALLQAPREGATTYAYCAYLDGQVVYPVPNGRWYDWLLDAQTPVRLHDLPVRRLRDDGGWQPIRSIMPPDLIRRIQPNVDMTTRAEMATALAALFKQNEAVVRGVLGGPVAEVRAEGGRWSLTMAAGDQMTLADAEVQDLLGRLDGAGADLSRAAAPLRTSSDSLRTVLDRVSGPIWNLPGTPDFDPGRFLNPNPSDDLQERTRTAMLVDPGAVGWEIAQEGTTLFHPGVGGNAVFTDTDQPIAFKPGHEPSREELRAIERILYHVGLEDDERINPAHLLSIPKVRDLLNNPHLLGTGYWTGASRNIRAVIRVQGAVRIRFATPYADTSYAVSVTPDYEPVTKSGPHQPISVHVLRRRADQVDLLFLRGTRVIDKANFSIAIHGELVRS